MPALVVPRPVRRRRRGSRTAAQFLSDHGVQECAQSLRGRIAAVTGLVLHRTQQGEPFPELAEGRREQRLEEIQLRPVRAHLAGLRTQVVDIHPGVVRGVVQQADQ